MKHYESGGFKVGDWVKVVNYGSLGWINDGGILMCVDTAPNRIGTVDFIDSIEEYEGHTKVGLSKSAWYDLAQLKKIEQPINETMKWFESPNAEGYLDM